MTTLPSCPRCKDDLIENTVLDKKFYYCRSCKDEIRMHEIMGYTSIGNTKTEEESSGDSEYDLWLDLHNANFDMGDSD